MRKIEKLMNQAINSEKNFSRDNTSVTHEDGVASVYLHGNLIAKVSQDALQLFDGDGWQTTTTKSRLNAILEEFGNNNRETVFQKQFIWYCNLWNNALKEYNTVKFRNGMILR
tara:strand:+ start:90 stop:428 length:339 start_codon:yes stop_codon:yes gene_type:complete